MRNKQWRVSIARPNHDTPPSNDGPRINEAIKARSVRCIDPEGEQLGILSIDDALDRAANFGMDLVELQPNAEPPVCKILDYGKYKYQAQKRANEARKKQKIIEVKEIKLRPNIDQHDYNVKRKAVEKFIDGGDKVKITLRFRGREMAHVELGAALLERVKAEIDEYAKVEALPKMEGRQMIMILAPK